MSARDELKEMARGFRWGRRPMVPRSAEPCRGEREDAGFPTGWARTEAGVPARQAILQGIMHPLVRNELSLRLYGLDHLQAVRGPVVFFSNHSSHLDATLILCTLPDRWQRRTAVGAARDYFFDVWWRQAFTALVYAGFPIDRAKGGKGIDKAKELVRDGWSIVVFPEGTRTPDGHMQRFRHGAGRGRGRDRSRAAAGRGPGSRACRVRVGNADGPRSSRSRSDSSVATATTARRWSGSRRPSGCASKPSSTTSPRRTTSWRPA